MLSQPAYDAARAFMLTRARPLERARFRYAFEGGDAGAVRDALAAYRTGEGGFGRAIEPDVRLDAAAPYPTTIGLQALRAIGAGPQDPLVADALAYLAGAYRADATAWQKVPAAVKDVPHAPWWHDPQPPTGFEANVGAEALGYFLHWGAPVPVGLLPAALAALDAADDALEMHDLLCWLRLAELSTGPVRDAVLAKLRAAVPASVSLDPAAWAGYAIRPLAVAPKPHGPVADLVAPALAADLDLTEAEQGEDGAWWPVWSWEGGAWADAKVEWAGVLTLGALETLAAHGRLGTTARRV